MVDKLDKHISLEPLFPFSSSLSSSFILIQAMEKRFSSSRFGEKLCSRRRESRAPTSFILTQAMEKYTFFMIESRAPSRSPSLKYSKKKSYMTKLAKQMLLMLVSCSAQYELKMAAYKISGIVHRYMDMLIIA